MSFDITNPQIQRDLNRILYNLRDKFEDYLNKRNLNISVSESRDLYTNCSFNVLCYLIYILQSDLSLLKTNRKQFFTNIYYQTYCIVEDNCNETHMHKEARMHVSRSIADITINYLQQLM